MARLFSCSLALGALFFLSWPPCLGIDLAPKTGKRDLPGPIGHVEYCTRQLHLTAATVRQLQPSVGPHGAYLNSGQSGVNRAIKADI